MAARRHDSDGPDLPLSAPKARAGSPSAGETVCTGTTTSGTTTSGTTTATTTSPGARGSASLDSPDYENTFTLDSCSLNADVENISLRGSADGLTLAVDATQGTGTLGVSGGTSRTASR